MSSAPKRNDATWMRALEAQPVSTPSWVPATQGGVRRAFTQPVVPPADPLAVERAALIQRTKDLEAAIGDYRASAASLNDAKKTLVASSIQELTALAFQVGRELAMQTLTNSPDAVAALILRLVNDLGSDARVTLRVAADDYSAISQAIEPSDALAISADPTLKPGACVITSKAARIETSFEQRERAVKRALGIDAQETFQ